jgi:adenosylcobinamide-GDP ribazoletransferase
MNAVWRHFVAALRFETPAPAPRRRAAAYVPLAGIGLGLVGAGVYWLAAQLWPASIAVVLSMLATTSIARPAAGWGLIPVFLVLVKYNALMALSSAKAPVVLAEYLTLGLIMTAGQAASRALVVSVVAADRQAVPRIGTADLAGALILGLAPAVLLGIPGLIGLAAAIAVRLVLGAPFVPTFVVGRADRLDFTQQSTEICFYLGALASWKYV